MPADSRPEESAPAESAPQESAPTEPDHHGVLQALISRRAEETPNAVYLEDARSDRSVTYGRFARSVALWRDAFGDLGIREGAAVLIDLNDPLSFAVAHEAVVACGLRSIPVDPDAPGATLERLSGLVGGAAMVISDREDRSQLPAITSATVDALTWSPSDLRFSSHAAAAAPREGGSAILFTSGSTGEPKGVELSEAQLLHVASAIATHNALTAHDRGFNPLPLFHVNAQVVGLLATLVAGGTLVLDRRFHRTGFWELLNERDITWLNAVPAILAVLARGGGMAVPARLRFIRSASAPLPDAVLDALGSTPLVISYGMTEAASQITATPLDRSSPPGSVGVPVGTEVDVRDDDGRQVAPGQVGSLWIRGDGVIDGYYAGRAADRFDADGWLHTGDVGLVDENGFVFLIGRIDDVINRGGEKVYPSEVEDVLLGDERVREAVVVGRADDILGAVPVAYVMLVDGTQDDSDLIDSLGVACKRLLPRSKRPVEINVVTDVPRAATGKVQRSRMRAELAGEQSRAAS
ncbi:MAG TPA: AMP-binding protein [Microbacteriaceae bacterium]|nr:AMP-binding protein [Microbacteriaceae bacterium]